MRLSSAPLHWAAAGRVPGSRCPLGIVVVPSSSAICTLHPALSVREARGSGWARFPLVPAERVGSLCCGKENAPRQQAASFPRGLSGCALLQEASGEGRSASGSIALSRAACNTPGAKDPFTAR